MRKAPADRLLPAILRAAGTLLLLGLAAASALAQGSWTNGQDARYVIGQPDFVSKSYSCSATTLDYPTGLALDLAHGKLYLADRSNGRVLRFAYPITGDQPTAELVFGRPDLTCSSSSGFDGQNTFRGVNGLAVDSRLTLATGTAEREAAMEMIEGVAGSKRITLGGDKGYDQRDFVEQLRANDVTPHLAQKNSGSTIDARTSRHPGYEVSQRVRKRIEEIFGWLKTVGGLSKTRYRGANKVAWMFTFALCAYNLVRMRNLGLSPP